MQRDLDDTVATLVVRGVVVFSIAIGFMFLLIWSLGPLVDMIK